MSKNKKNKEYSSLRLITITLTALMLPFGTFVGFQFGSRNYRLALIALAIQTIITFIQAHIWWLTLEKSGR